MKCFLWDEQKFFIVNRKEEITDNVFLLTDYEEEKIKETLQSGGHFWIEGNEIKWSGVNPSDVTVWDDTTHEWVVDQDLYNNALSLLKAKLWEDVKSLRLFKSTDGTLIPSINKWAHNDEVSQITYTRAKDYLELNPDITIDWKMMDGSFIKIDSTLLKEICSKVFELGQASFINAEVHRVKINNIND